MSQFFNLYQQGFTRVNLCVPETKVADVPFNLKAILEQIDQAQQQKSSLVVFPELCLTSYSCDDLFNQKTLLNAALTALNEIVAFSAELYEKDILKLKVQPIIIIGLPLEVDQALYNVAAVIHQGKILGIVPKTYLPNYREFYEVRQFASASAIKKDYVTLNRTKVPFGNNLLFKVDNSFSFFVEICEDVWVPIPRSCYAALAGANVLINLSASNITVGKADYRHNLVENQSARCLAAYLYTAAGPGESSTDLAWDGQALVYENGQLLAESKRFETSSQMIQADIDLEKLNSERRRQNSFAESAQNHKEEIKKFLEIEVPLVAHNFEKLDLQRTIAKFPFVPAQGMDQRCEEILTIQTQALAKRLKSSKMEHLVLGVSGGLDSTLALIVAIRVLDQLHLPHSKLLAYTMPGFATSSQTLNNALALMKAVGCQYETLDIKPSCLQMLQDIKHSGNYDITFENVQAGERTSHLFRLANLHKGLVIGTGDLSELALGWCTYGVGDHMSHYGVNAGVPKTLIKHLVNWVATKNLLGEEVSKLLEAIVNTKISPELVPGDQTQPSQGSEDAIGPYELQDFNLYYIVRFGYTPTKVAYLAYHAWKDKYSLKEIKKWLEVFLKRFFGFSQFKRSCLPNGPKVGSVSLSPRGDYRAPSDSEVTVWLNDLQNIPME